MKIKVILFVIVTITTIHQINAHWNHHWKPSEDCLNGRIDARKCCLASEATIYLKHPKYCGQYYKCENKHLELKLCHLGRHWSVQHQKCEKAKEAHCKNAPTTTTTTTTPKPSQWQLPNGCYDGSITVNECCKISQRWYEVIPDQNDCHKFYKCYKGKSYHLSCPPHFKWSGEKRKCVYALHTGCDTKPTKTTTESTLTTVAPEKLPYGCYDGSIPSSKCCKMDIGKSRDVPIEALIGENFDLDEFSRHNHHSSSSEEKIFNGELLADPKNCHKYYKCVLGKPLHLACPYHTKWNIQSRKCVYALNTKCTDPEPTTTSTTTTTEIPTTKTTETTTITTPAPWRLPDGCYDGSIKAKECCKIEMNTRDITSLIGENFDFETYSKHHSGSSSSEETINWNNETLADPKDCHKYFQCKNGKPVHLSCPKHNKWNTELRKCVYSDSTKCTDPDSTSKPTTEAEVTSSIFETSTITTTPVSTTTVAPWRLPKACYDGSIKAPKCCKIKINETMDVSSSSGSSSKERQDISLKTLIAENFDLIESTKHSGSKSSEEENNFNTESLADPKNCHKYFKCENGKPIHKSCPKHTKWNIELGQCVHAIYEKCSDAEPTPTPPLTTTESSEIATSEETSATTSYETTSTELSTSTSEETTTTEGPATTEAKTTTERPITPEKTTTIEITTDGITTTETVTSTSGKTTSTEAVSTTEELTTSEALTTTERPVTSERTTTTEVTTTTSETATPTSEKTTITEAATTSKGPTTTEAAITTKRTTTPEEITTTETTTEAITTTETVTSTPEETTTTEVAKTTEAISTTETAASTSETTTEYNTTEGSTITETVTTTERPTTSEKTTATEGNTTTEAIITTETATTVPEKSSTEAAITTEAPTTPKETTTTEIITTTETTTTNESFTTTVETEITNTEGASTTEATTTEAITTTEDVSTITTEIITSTETTSTTTAEPITSTTGDAATTTETTITTTEAPTTTEKPTTTEAITTSTETTITTEGTPTTVMTISTTTEGSVTTTTAITEFPNNSTTEENTDPTPDPNGSCGTASYKCRHGIISAEECCKGVPYWEDRLLQNNENCGTYFQCVHEVPQVRICPGGLYWNADVCRCEWKQLSTCNF